MEARVIRRFLTLFLAPAALSVAIAAGALAQSSDGRLVGTWNGQAGDEKIMITFNADGSALMGDQTGAQPGRYTADFSKSPGTLTLSVGGDDSKRHSLIEFVDDNHVRISQPSSDLPPSMSEAVTVVFEREAK